MPFVNIKVTGGAEAPTAEQKAELISGVTELLQRVLNKNYGVCYGTDSVLTLS